MGLGRVVRGQSRGQRQHFACLGPLHSLLSCCTGRLNQQLTRGLLHLTAVNPYIVSALATGGPGGGPVSRFSLEVQFISFDLTLI